MKAAIATLALVCCLAAPAGAHLKGWNIANDYGALPRPDGQFYQDLGPAKRSGADVLRVYIYWQQMQSARNVRWMTRYLRTIRRMGMKIDLLVWNPNNASMENNREQFAAACAKAARLWQRYLLAIEVGNEPNALLQPSMTRAQFEQADAKAAAAYVPVVQDSYRAIKQVAPHLTVLAGAMAFSDGTFLEDAYADGFGGYFDGLAVHPYTYNAPPGARGDDPMFSLAYGLPWLHRIMAEHGDGQRDVWITEVGWNTIPSAGVATATDAQRAHYVRQLGAITRRWPWLGAVMFYQLRYQGRSSPDVGWAFIDRLYRPSESYRAFQTTTF